MWFLWRGFTFCTWFSKSVNSTFGKSLPTWIYIFSKKGENTPVLFCSFWSDEGKTPPWSNRSLSHSHWAKVNLIYHWIIGRDLRSRWFTLNWTFRGLAAGGRSELAMKPVQVWRRWWSVLIRRTEVRMVGVYGVAGQIAHNCSAGHLRQLRLKAGCNTQMCPECSLCKIKPILKL